MTIYPNPGSGVIHIHGELSESVVAMDMQAKIVLEAQHNNKIDLSHLEHGVYVLHIKRNNSTIVRRYIKK